MMMMILIMIATKIVRIIVMIIQWTIMLSDNDDYEYVYQCEYDVDYNDIKEYKW